MLVPNTYRFCSSNPQTEQHEPEGQMLFCLGNVTNLLDVTPSNLMPYPLPSLHILLMLFRFKELVVKQHPTKLGTFLMIILSRNFGTHHAEFPKPKRDPACVYG